MPVCRCVEKDYFVHIPVLIDEVRKGDNFQV